MIIWINGAFGSGKTQTAYELQRRLPGSYVYDPENIGYFIRRSLPQAARVHDFQDYPMWRDFNYSMLKYLSSACEGVIIAPMTIVNARYFGEIVGKLRSDGIVVEHFTLWASREVLTRRLRGRGEKTGSWPERQIDRCIEALADPLFERHIDTDHLPVEAIVEEIAAAAGVRLEADARGPLRKMHDRVVRQLLSIRFPK